MLELVQRVFFGPLKEPGHDRHAAAVSDLSLREASALVPLAVFVFWIGLYPEFFLSRMRPALHRLSDRAIQVSVNGGPTRDGQTVSRRPPVASGNDARHFESTATHDKGPIGVE
jgi:hypothetical protein